MAIQGGAPAERQKSLRLNWTRLTAFLLLLVLLYLQSYRDALVHVHGDDLVRVGDVRQASIPFLRFGTLLRHITKEEYSLGERWQHQPEISDARYRWYPFNETVVLYQELKASMYSFKLHYPCINYTEEFTLSGPWVRGTHREPHWLPFIAVFTLLFVFCLIVWLLIIFVLLVCGVVCCTIYE